MVEEEAVAAEVGVGEVEGELLYQRGWWRSRVRGITSGASCNRGSCNRGHFHVEEDGRGQDNINMGLIFFFAADEESGASPAAPAATEAATEASTGAISTSKKTEGGKI